MQSIITPLLPFHCLLRAYRWRGFILLMSFLVLNFTTS